MTIEYTDAQRAMLGRLTETAEADLQQLMEDYERRGSIQLTELERALDSASSDALEPIALSRVEFLTNWRSLLESRLNRFNILVIPPDDELVAQAKATITDIQGNLNQLVALVKTHQKQRLEETKGLAKKQLDLQKELATKRTARFAQYAEKQREFQRQRGR